MPVATFILSRTGVLNHKFLRKRYKYAVLAIFIAAAVITPTPDIFNMILLAAPMLLLYEASVWVAYFAGPRIPKEKNNLHYRSYVI
jgi:sec-independent protein translocase protein TatC